MVPDEVVNAPVFIMAQNPHTQEEEEGRPMVGRTGQMQERVFFPLLGVQRGEVSIGNAIRCRVGRGTQLPPLRNADLKRAIAHCAAAFFRPPDQARVFLAQGEYALYALSPAALQDDITSWRGWVVPYDPVPRLVRPQAFTSVWTPAPTDRVVLATLHLASLFHNTKTAFALRQDWLKVNRLLNHTWPESFPEVQDTQRGEISLPERPWSFDSEYDPVTGQLLMWSVAGRGSEGEPSVWVAGAGALLYDAPHQWVFHNALADLGHFETVTGFRSGDYHVEDTMYLHAALWGGQPHDLDYLGSLYARTNRWKHLSENNKRQYSAGDALGTFDAWVRLRWNQLDQDDGSRQTYKQRLLPLLPIIRATSRKGIRVNLPLVAEAKATLNGVKQDAVLQAQLGSGWPINLGSPEQVAVQLYKIEHLQSVKQSTAKSLGSVDMESLRALRKRTARSSVALEQRLRFSEADSFVKQLGGFRSERCYPNYLPTAQLHGRWSITQPALATLASDGLAALRGFPALEHVVIPDPGTAWLCWDWDALHARFTAAACNDLEDIRAFQGGLDIHTITACRMFGLPLPPDLRNPHSDPDCEAWRTQHNWKGKADRRRHLAKTVRYALLNALDERGVLESKEIEVLGLKPDDVLRAGKAYLRGKPGYTEWKHHYIKQCLKQRVARSIFGRRLLLVGNTETMSKAALGQFLQGSEADLLNTVLIELYHTHPELQYVYSTHDGVKLSMKLDPLEGPTPQEVKQAIQPIVEAPRIVFGQAMSFPATWTSVQDNGTVRPL